MLVVNVAGQHRPFLEDVLFVDILDALKYRKDCYRASREVTAIIIKHLLSMPTKPVFEPKQISSAAGAVLAANVSLTASVPIIDVTGSEPVEHRGAVPARAVVVPGTRPKEFPAGTYQIDCALIIGWRKDSHDEKLSLNEVLREFELAV